MNPEFVARQNELKRLFETCHTQEEKYQKIIELGKKQKLLDAAYKIEENRVRGCQSVVFLVSRIVDGKIYFEVESDALISAGLAQLLLFVYDGQPPETVLKYPPKYLEELGIAQTLTPGRANGLASIYI